MKSSYIKIRPKTLINISRIVTIHYYEFGPNFVFQGESHDFWEMVYVDKGKVQVRRDEEDLILKQGELLFHQPNEFHSIRSLDSSPNFFVISFSSASPAMAYFEKRRTQLDATLKPYLSSIIKEAEKTYNIPKNDPNLRKLHRKEDAPLGGEQLIQTYLEQLLIFLLRTITKEGSLVSFPKKGSLEDPLVAAIKQYLAQHITDTVRIEDICNEFDYSRSYLNKRFQNETGQSLAAYFIALKIEEAKRLIRDSDLNFAQISERLSFDNPQYFSRVFKNRTGMTPTEFKNRAHI